jgi:DNA mismatch endonuclease, patch repair protein
MQSQRQRDTQPELALRRALHARGWRFRVDIPPLAGLRRRADIVFTRQRVAVYVDGCFWHGCPTHGTTPKSNTAWWVAKIRANVERDHDTDRRLRTARWSTVRVWEHASADEAVQLVEQTLLSPDRAAICCVD